MKLFRDFLHGSEVSWVSGVTLLRMSRRVLAEAAPMSYVARRLSWALTLRVAQQLPFGGESPATTALGL